MGILRSEKMKSGTLILPYERARHYINLVGSHVNLEFRDENETAVQPNRPYKKYVQRIDEMERILRFLAEEIARYRVRYMASNGMKDSDEEASTFLVPVKDNVEGFLQSCDMAYKLDTVEASLKQSYTDFVGFAENNAKLLDARNKAVEEKCFLEIAIDTYANLNKNPNAGLGGNTVFSNIAGVVNLDEKERLARMIFRTTHGNTFTHFQEIEGCELLDPKTHKYVKKAVFIIYFQDMLTAVANATTHRGDGRGSANQSAESARSAMYNRVRNVCKSFGVHMYDLGTQMSPSEQTDERLGHLDALKIR